MILDAIHSTINSIVSAYPMIGDISAVVPFCVFNTEPDPIRTKDGIVGYSQKVSVVLIDDSLDRIDTNIVSVRNAVIGMSGTINSTVINSVIQTGESGAIFDKETNTYQNSLEFIFDTDNR